MQGFNDYFEHQAQYLIEKTIKIKKRSTRQHIYRAAILTIYGFQVAIPVLIGIFLGMFLDKHFPLEHIAWTLNLIIIGFIVGFYNANRWFYHMVELHKHKTSQKKGEKK